VIWLRSAGAIVGGFATMVVVVMLATLAGVQLPGMLVDGAPTTLWLGVNLAYSLVAAVAGGWVAAALAAHSRWWHGVALATFIALSWLLDGMQPMPGQPQWYPAVITLVGAGGVLIGARWRDQRD
jgi:hypothetical protein